MDQVARVRLLVAVGVLLGLVFLVVGLLIGNVALAVIGGLLMVVDLGFLVALTRRRPR